MAFKRFADIVKAYDTGNSHYTSFRKIPSQVTTAWVWFDLSMSPGNPPPQYYAASPLIGQVMKQSDQGWLFHRGDISPKWKYLARSTLMTNNVNGIWPYTLLDYLYYYPFIDEGSTDEQFVDNTNPMNRYIDGAWVQIMWVSVAARTGWARFQVKYTNQDWVEWRITPIHITTIASANGTILTSSRNWVTTGNQTSTFLTLEWLDTWVRKIESVTMIDPDVWLFSLVLVKPLMNTCIVWIDAPVEVDYIRDRSTLIEIKPDAFLWFITAPLGSLSWVSILWDLTFIFN